MTGIVLELQRDALDRSTRVTELLRKALVVARKLRLAEFQAWVERELVGYSGEDADRFPDYRRLRGQVRGHNPYTGQWMPLFFEDAAMAEVVSVRANKQPLPEIEDLVSRGTIGTFHMPFPESIRKELSKGFDFETQISLFTDKAALVGVLEAVRTIVLNWSLKLEEDGIMGEHMSFTDKEKAAASAVPQNVNNFFGPVHGQQLQQGNTSATQTQFNLQLDPQTLLALVVKLRTETGGLGLSEELAAELTADTNTLEQQAKSPAPKSGIVRETLKSIRSVLEGATGGAAGQLLLELGKLLAGSDG
jgi:AbiTii